jgi:hypothetical protein
MRKNPNVKLWQFPVQNNRSRFLDGGRGHFELRSAERAAALGCRIEAVKRVRLRRLRNNVWTLNGIVVLEGHEPDAGPSLVLQQVTI